MDRRAEGLVVDEKECLGCGNCLPLDDFYKMVKSPDGRQPMCIHCSRRRDGTGRKDKKSSKMCNTCFDMNHRVQGETCMECGRTYQEEELPSASEMYADARPGAGMETVY